MKVLKEGRQQQGWAKEFTCTGEGNSGGGCGAVLLVEEDDLFTTQSCDYLGDCEHFVTFRCSACGVLTDIKDYGGTKKLPTWKQWLDNRRTSC